MTTLLTYELVTDPNPLEIGKPGYVTLVAYNDSTSKVYCRDISLVLPLGPYALQLGTTGEGLDPTLNSTDWTSSRVTDSQQLVTPRSEWYEFPADRTSVLTVQFPAVNVSPQPGSALITIRETAATKPGEWPAVPEFTTLRADKQPVRTTVTKVTNPVRDFRVEQVKTDGSVELRWECDGKPELRLEHGPQATPEAAFVKLKPGATQWKGTVCGDTIFRLIATLPSGSRDSFASTVTVLAGTDRAVHKLTPSGTVRILGDAVAIDRPRAYGLGWPDGEFPGQGQNLVAGTDYATTCDGILTLYGRRLRSGGNGTAELTVAADGQFLGVYQWDCPYWVPRRDSKYPEYDVKPEDSYLFSVPVPGGATFRIGVLVNDATVSCWARWAPLRSGSATRQ